MKPVFSSRGVLLTLGITFMSLVVLSFATLILRNAENSDLRLTELSSIDRIYTLSSSLERSVFRSYFPLTGINLTLNNDTFTIAKDTKRSGSPNYFQPPDTIDPVIFGMKTSDLYVQLLAESLTYKTTTLNNALGFALLHFLPIIFYYPSYDPNPFKSVILYAYGDDEINITKDYNFRHTAAGASYCCLEVNNKTDIYPINSTFQIFLLGNNLSELKEIQIKARHPTRCPYINWSKDTWSNPFLPPHGSGTRREAGTLSGGEVKVKISVLVENEKDSCPPSYSYYSQVENDAKVNSSSVAFSQIIFLDNLTDGDGSVAYNFEYPDDPFNDGSAERPVIFIYDQLVPTGTQVTTAANILYLVQYDNPIRWEVTLKYNFGPLEVYSTEYVTSSLPPLNVSRTLRPARFK